MKSTYELIETQLNRLLGLENDLENLIAQIHDDRTYLEQEIEIYEKNGDEKSAEKYYDELDILLYPVRNLEREIRDLKRSILEDYAELILITVGDISLANSILKAKRSYVQTEKIIKALLKRFISPLCI